MNQTENFSVVNKPVVTLILSTLLEYVMLFGIVGNVMSLFIFSRPCLNRKTNSGKLYAFLCLLSLIIIVYEMADRKLESFFSFKIRMHLKTEKVINTILLQYWSWIQVLITVDRFIGVFYPVKGVGIMGNKRLLLLIILAMFIVIAGLNSPNYIRCSTFTVGNITYQANDMMCDNIAILTDVVRILVQFIIPYFIMVIIDFMVIIRLRKSKTGLSANNKSFRFTRNTIIIDIIYLFFNFPPTFFNMYYFLLNFPSRLPKIPIQYLAILSPLFKYFSNIYSSLFFLIFLIFNTIFRSEFIVVFRLDKCFIAIQNRFC